MRVYSYGRLTSCPARLWERALSHRGGSRTKRLQQADLVVIGGGAASRPESDILQVISGARQADQLVLSERAFLRSIGLAPAMPPETMAYGLEEVAVLAKLPGDRVRLLAAFDVIEGTNGRFGFRAIRAASVAARLIAEGNSLAEIVSACNRIRLTLRVSSPLSQFQVRPDDDGNLALCLADGMAELDGQLRLPIDGASSDIDDLLSAAQEARSTDEAERLLRRALAAAPADPEVLFELGSLLCERSAFAEGVALLHKAAILSPDLADAWYNIGCALERQSRPAEARRAYQRAIAADPAYADPIYNLGMLALDEHAYDDAIGWLERYLSLDPRSPWAAKARKGLMLARLSLSAAAVSRE